jgi:L-arabinonolactonase
MNIDILLDVKTMLGEGPLWDVDQQRLYWIDSFGQRIFRATAAGSELRAWLVPAPIGSMALTRDASAARSSARSRGASPCFYPEMDH